MSILTVQHLEKHFENTKVLNDISFSLEEGQALSIIGSSGSGKTTLLRCLNFLETPDAGTITVQDKVLFDADHHANCSEKEIRKNRLHFGMVFQSFNLFPQYTALENVTLARELMAKDSGESKEAIRAAGMELLDQMGLADRAGHYPHQLSGGQQQRVAIARALALHPDILCFDEPTSALDPELTMEIKGRNLVDGLPKNIVVHSEDVRGALLECLVKITTAIKETLERTPPELSADIIDRGITLTGGGALLRGLDQLIQSETGIDVLVAEDPLDCVAKGAGAVLDHVDVLHDVLDTDGGHM